MRDALVLARYHTKMVVRGMRFIWFGCLLPVMTFFIMAVALKGTDYVPSGLSIANFLLPGHLLIIIVYTMNFVLGYNYFRYKEDGTFTNYQLLGVPKRNVLLSLWGTSFLFQLVSSLILITTVVLFCEVSFQMINMPLLLLAIALVNFLEFALTYLLVIISGTYETFNIAAITVFLIQVIFGGLTIPPELFSKVAYDVVQLMNPIYYGLKVIREVWWFNATLTGVGEELITLVIVTAILFTTAYYLEKRLCVRK